MSVTLDPRREDRPPITSRTSMWTVVSLARKSVDRDSTVCCRIASAVDIVLVYRYDRFAGEVVPPVECLAAC
jgi:hypothetical protein